MIKIKLGAFATVSAIILGTFAFPRLHTLLPDRVQRVNGNVIQFNKEFREDVTTQASKHMKDINKLRGTSERALITITSPGGGVFDGRQLFVDMLEGVPVDTYVPVMAASMGAQMFIQGKERYVEPDALVLFHGAHAGTYDVSQPILEKKVELLTSWQFKRLILAFRDGKEFEDLKTIEKDIPEHLRQFVPQLVDEVMQRGETVVEMDLRSILDMLVTINESSLDEWETVIAQSNGTWTKDRIRREIYSNFEKDMIFTGKQLAELGLAKLGKPDIKRYSEVD